MITAQNVKVSRDESTWEVEVRAEIPAESLSQYRSEALKELQKTAKLDGFRPGKAPESRILEVYGEPTLMRHATEHAIQHELPEILAKENLFVIESPKVTSEQPESGKPLVFTARAALAPEVTLPDYKEIAKHVMATNEDTSVSDAEHKEAMLHLRRERARIDKIESGTDNAKAVEESSTMKEEELPALDDAFVQSIGYESADKFSEVLRSNIQNEKELRAREKRRASLLDQLVEKSKIHMPSILKEFELDEIEGRLQSDLEQSGHTIENYLRETKKTREELRKEWTPGAEKRAKVRLILSRIAQAENIVPPAEQLEKEVENAKKHYPAAEADALRTHIAHAMRNEATLQFLEKLEAAKN